MLRKDLSHRTSWMSVLEKRTVSKQIMRTKIMELPERGQKAGIYKGNQFCRNARTSVGRKKRSRKDNNEVKSAVCELLRE